VYRNARSEAARKLTDKTANVSLSPNDPLASPLAGENVHVS
jgi:hypothetical protein